MPWIEQAMRIDPLSGGRYETDLSARLCRGRVDEAAGALEGSTRAHATIRKTKKFFFEVIDGGRQLRIVEDHGDGSSTKQLSIAIRFYRSGQPIPRKVMPRGLDTF